MAIFVFSFIKTALEKTKVDRSMIPMRGALGDVEDMKEMNVKQTRTNFLSSKILAPLFKDLRRILHLEKKILI